MKSYLKDYFEENTKEVVECKFNFIPDYSSLGDFEQTDSDAELCHELGLWDGEKWITCHEAEGIPNNANDDYWFNLNISYRTKNNVSIFIQEMIQDEKFTSFMEESYRFIESITKKYNFVNTDEFNFMTDIEDILRLNHRYQLLDNVHEELYLRLRKSQSSDKTIELMKEVYPFNKSNFRSWNKTFTLEQAKVVVSDLKLKINWPE